MTQETPNNQLYFDDKTSYKIFIDNYNYAIKKPIQWKIKRAIDISHSLAGIIALLPVFVIISVIIKIESDGPALFKQERLGMSGKLFTMYKFRTMYENNDVQRVMDENDYRITKFGKFLRKYSLDEIPQLFNVLKGDMSLVGPRPVREFIFQQIQSVEPKYELRFATKPGLRLNNGDLDRGANAEMAKTEREYIEKWSLFNDLEIFVKVVYNAVRGKNY